MIKTHPYLLIATTWGKFGSFEIWNFLSWFFPLFDWFWPHCAGSAYLCMPFMLGTHWLLRIVKQKCNKTEKSGFGGQFLAIFEFRHTVHTLTFSARAALDCVNIIAFVCIHHRVEKRPEKNGFPRGEFWEINPNWK